MINAPLSKRKLIPYFVNTTISIGLGLSGVANAALEEVIVTAQKREQSVQEVPIAMTALSEEALQTNRVANVVDLSGLAPNVIARPAAGGSSIASFSVRGITSYGVVPGSDKEVSIYLDGVYISSPQGSIFSLPDIAQLEVLRGPQGTLFGRNATAGAINITTRDPAGELGLRQEISVGDHEYRRSRTSIDSPTWGPFSFTGTYMTEEREGDVKNRSGGTVWNRASSGYGTYTSPDHLGNKDAENYFLAARFQPTDTFTMTYKFDHAIDNGSTDASVPVGLGRSANGVGQFLTNLTVANQPTPVQLVPNARRPSSVDNAFASPLDVEVTGHSLTTLVDLNDSVALKNITAFRKAGVRVGADLAGLGELINIVPQLGPVGAPICIVCSQTEADSDQWSSELQVNYESDLLTSTVGLLYFESKDRAGSLINQPATMSLRVLPNHVIPAGNEAVSFNEAQSLAAYTQVEYHLADDIDLVGGLRWTRDRKSGTYRYGTDPNKLRQEFSWEDAQPSYSVGVNYKPTYDSLVYAKYSTSFVSGGSVGGIDFEAEDAKSWEAGVKSDFLESTIRTNLSVFDVTYKHVQSPQSGTNIGRPELVTAIVDQGESHAYGAEWEGSASVGYGLTLNASLGYTHVYYNDVNPVLVRSVGGDLYPGSKYLPALIPDWTGSLGAQYESAPLFGPAYISANVAGTWHSKIRMDSNPARADANPQWFEYSPESWVVNARVALREIDLGFASGEIGLWGRNLTDNDYPTFGLNLGGLSQSASFMEARSFGADFIVQF